MANVITKNISRLYTKVRSRLYKREKDLWVFGEWLGNRCCGNSLYFANYVAEHHPELRLVWIGKKSADTSLLDPSVRVVEMDTPEAVEVLKKAGVAVMNQGRGDFSAGMDFHIDGAVTVNLWHGVPWKLIGADMMKNQSFLKRVYTAYGHFIQRPDCALALSEDFADILARTFYVSPKNVIRAGYPRNSIFYDPQKVRAIREKVLTCLRKDNGIDWDTVKIITYMPTFRDNTQQVFSFEQLQEDPQLNALLRKHNAVIVQRAHFVSSQRNADDCSSGNPRITAVDGVSSQELLAATDLLVTDYSSCFFDYLLLDRPIVHYLYDYDYYANEDRGLYYKKDDVVCGDAAQTAAELLRAIDANLSDPGKDTALRARRQLTYLPYESKDSCEIIFREICKRQK